MTFFGHSDLEWATAQLDQRGLTLVDHDDDFPAQAAAAGLEAVVIDGYEFPSSLGQGLQEREIAVAAMVDGEFGVHQQADLYVDQNLGAVRPQGAAGTWLLGTRFALLRDVVLHQIGRRGQVRAETPKVLVVFGGSDPFGGAPVATQLLLETGSPVAVTVIGVGHAVNELRSLALTDGQSVEVIGRVEDLPALAVQMDLVVSAAGSTVWEMAALGIPTALIPVVDNQDVGYLAAIRELCVGLGHLSALRGDAETRQRAVGELRRLLSDPRARAELGQAGRALVDGRGRVRVADAIERLANWIE